MSNLLHKLFFIFGRVISILQFDTIFKIIRSTYKYLYTGCIQRQFASFGKGSLIFPPMLSFRGGSYISIGNNTTIGESVQLTAWDSYQGECFSPMIRIGDHCNIRAYSHISAINEIIIGDHLLTGTNVLISDNSHGIISYNNMTLPPSERLLFSKGRIKIGNNVWLGNNVIILANVEIGDGVIIGANSVVTSNIPAFSVAVGVPAKVVKQLTCIKNE